MVDRLTLKSREVIPKNSWEAHSVFTLRLKVMLILTRMMIILWNLTMIFKMEVLMRFMIRILNCQLNRLNLNSDIKDCYYIYSSEIVN